MPTLSQLVKNGRDTLLEKKRSLCKSLYNYT